MRTGVNKTILALGMIGMVGCGEAGASNQSEQKRSEDLYIAGCRFSEKDFPKENSSEKLFYVAEGEDDGLQEVRPNLKRMPERLKNALSMFHGYRPPSEGVDNRGEIYVCDSSADTIKHVGDGWVVARSRFERKFVGFIYTDETDMYIEGQNLKRGYYVLVGRQKVQLVNGSSLSMYAFAKLDKESNRLAMETVKYNKEAEAAARKENMQRTEKRKEIAKEQNKQKFYDELSRLFNGFSFRDVRSQFHLPEGMADVTNEVEVLNPGTVHFFHDHVAVAETEFMDAIRTNNWGFITKLFMCDNMRIDDPEKSAKVVFDKAHLLNHEIHLKYQPKNDASRKYVFYLVNRYGWGDGDYREEIYKVGIGDLWGSVRLPIDAEVYCIREVDDALVSKFDSRRNRFTDVDVDGFIAVCKEREEYNKKLDKYCQEMERLLAELLSHDMKAQCHFPTNALGDTIEITNNSVLYGDPSENKIDKDVNDAMKKHDWNMLEKILKIQNSIDADPVQCAKDVFARVYLHERGIHLKWSRGGSQGTKRSIKRRRVMPMTAKDEQRPEPQKPDPVVCFFIVNKMSEEQVRFVGTKCRRDYTFSFKVNARADLFCVQDEDKEVFNGIRDAKTFAETWDKKYGATANR